MIKQKQDEARIEYLARVLKEFMDNTIAGEETIDYDGINCDGACLAQDIFNEVEELSYKGKLK